MTEHMIEWQNVSFSVPHGFWMKSKTIVSGMNLSVSPGMVLGLIGPNGAGKTTTIKLGAGLLRPTSGRVLIQDHPVTVSINRRQIGLLTEIPYVYPFLRLKEWIMLGAGLSGVPRHDRQRRADKVLELVELSDRAHQMMRTLSKGQLQRAGIAQALVHEPTVLLLDEPMSGLDPFWRYRFQQILLEFKAAGGTILLSSHIISDLERITDHIALIAEGMLQWSGRLTDLPRENKGYEVICRIGKPAEADAIIENLNLEHQPDGLWRTFLNDHQKAILIGLAFDGKIVIESLRPVQQEIEEVLFGFYSKFERQFAKDQE